MKAEKKCQNQTGLAGELTENELESIVGGAGSSRGHWIWISDKKGTREVWVPDSPTVVPFDSKNAVKLGPPSQAALNRI